VDAASPLDTLSRAETSPILQMRGMVRSFGPITACDGVDFDLKAGEIHALVGENGAGKTTLMNMLYGLIRPDEGDVTLRGREVRFNSPADAIAHGLGMVHQRFMLIPRMTVAENVIIGRETGRGPFIGLRKAESIVRGLSNQFGLEVEPGALIESLPLSVRQRVELLKALYRKADILILDEPTAVLTPSEADQLFAILKKLVDSGKSVILITHKLDEVLNHAGRLTVLRAGQTVWSAMTSSVGRTELARMMVGTDLTPALPHRVEASGDPVLEVTDLTVSDASGRRLVNRAGFCVHEGEIYGLAGIMGNGQVEMIQALTGLLPVNEGRIVIGGQETVGMNSREIRDLGVAHIPEDPVGQGLMLDASAADNLALTGYRYAPLSRGFLLDTKAIQEHAVSLIRDYKIQPPWPESPAAAFSGGNQHRLVVARELSRSVKLYIVVNPTSGLDIRSAHDIHNRILTLRDNGAAVFLISTDLDEIIRLSDRVGVMYKGRITAELAAEQIHRDRLGPLMAGIDDTTVPEKGYVRRP
jgi:ABC-type uncharacterized transport system ATPase subunit